MTFCHCLLLGTLDEAPVEPRFVTEVIEKSGGAFISVILFNWATKLESGRGGFMAPTILALNSLVSAVIFGLSGNTTTEFRAASSTFYDYMLFFASSNIFPSIGESLDKCEISLTHMIYELLSMN